MSSELTTAVTEQQEGETETLKPSDVPKGNENDDSDTNCCCVFLECLGEFTLTIFGGCCRHWIRSIV